MTYWSRLTALSSLCKINQRSSIFIRTYAFKPQSIPKNAPGINQVRHRSVFRLFTQTSPAKFRIKDNIPESFELIYRNTMENYLLCAQIISAGCLLVVAVVVVITCNSIEDTTINFEEWNKRPNAVENEVFLYLFSLAAMCVLLQMIVVRMPLRIYNCKNLDKYIFVNYSAVPFMKKSISCLRTDISKLPDSGILPWNKSRYDVKNNPAIIIDNFFRTPADLYIMLRQQDYADDDD